MPHLRAEAVHADDSGAQPMDLIPSLSHDPNIKHPPQTELVSTHPWDHLVMMGGLFPDSEVETRN